MSNHGFLKHLVKLSAANHRATAVASGRFNDSSREYRFLLQALDSGVTGHNPIMCPACKGGNHCALVQTDGLSKLICYKSQRKDNSDSHHYERNNVGCHLFPTALEVQADMDKMYVTDPSNGESTCGNSVFKALQTPKSFSKLQVS